MALTQLVYVSRPFGFDLAVLGSILATARHFNRRDEITGALICRDDLYCQMLEGPETAVDEAYRRILRDDRHLEVSLRLSRKVEQRMFPDWAMRDDPVASWMWSREAVADGAPQRADADEVSGIFERLASEPARPAEPTNAGCPAGRTH